MIFPMSAWIARWNMCTTHIMISYSKEDTLTWTAILIVTTNLHGFSLANFCQICHKLPPLAIAMCLCVCVIFYINEPLLHNR